MPRKKDSNYRAAVEKLREKHADKVEEVFLKMYDIALNGKEQKDSVNAAKVCVSLLGVPKPPTMAKEPDKPSEIKKDKPTLSKEHNAILDDILGKL